MSANEWMLSDMFANLKVTRKEEYHPLIIDYGRGRPNDSTGEIKIPVASVAMYPEFVNFRN